MMNGNVNASGLPGQAWSGSGETPAGTGCLMALFNLASKVVLGAAGVIVFVMIIK